MMQHLNDRSNRGGTRRRGVVAPILPIKSNGASVRRRRRRRKSTQVYSLAVQLTIAVVTFVGATYAILICLRAFLIPIDDDLAYRENELATSTGNYGPTCRAYINPFWINNPMIHEMRNIKCEQSRDDASHSWTKLFGLRSRTTTAAAPRKMADTMNPIYFLHIGKAGGTSIDALFKEILKCDAKMYLGEHHYDWSYIQKHQLLKKGKQERQQYLGHGEYDIGQTADVITFLRDPVSRGTSQFYFSKRLPWARKQNATFLYQTFDEYLDDPNKSWMQPIADGESGTDFLAGIFPSDADNWVGTDGVETDLKAYLRNNKTAACILAAQRLENTTWFGLMDDIDRSMKLLQGSLGLEVTPDLPSVNKGWGDNPKPTSETLERIRKYVPKDLWLYEYSKQLFEARWNYVMGEDCTYVSPELPPLPDFE